MRIIAGEFRGRNLLAPADDSTRPITDRVKQSLFDILNPYIEGAVVYDCFAGTGSMGLECLSRGAANATFFEMGRSAQQLLKRNIETLKVKDRSTIVGTDLFKWFGGTDVPDAKANLIFLDPPYRFLREKPGELQKLAEFFAGSHLAPEGIVIFRHDSADVLELNSLRRYDTREYGSMTLEFLTCRS